MLDLPIMCPAIFTSYFERAVAFPVFTGWYECRAWGSDKNDICWTRQDLHKGCKEPYIPEAEAEAA